MKTSILILSVLLLFSIGLNLYQGWQAKINQEFAFGRNIAFNDAIEKARQTAAIYADSVNELAIRLALTRDSVKVAQNARKEEIKAYRKTIENLRRPVAVMIDTIPDLREFVTAQDSIISKQDDLIRGMELSHSAELLDMNEIIRLQNHQLNQQMAITATFETELTATQGENNKLRRGKNVRNVIIAGLVGIVIFQQATK